MKRLALFVFVPAVLVFVGCSGGTDPATNVTSVSAQLNAHGHTTGEPATWWWEYDTVQSDLGTANDTEVCGAGTGPKEPDNRCGPASWENQGDINLNVVVTGLTPNTTYYFRACAQDQSWSQGACGTVYSFTTLARATLAQRWNGSAWANQNTPNPAGVKYAGFGDVSCTSSTACTAVGSSAVSDPSASVVLAERWNGSSWAIQATPGISGSSALSGVSCTSATACLAVGSNGAAPLADRWDGSSWAIVATPPLPAGATSGRLGEVSCTSATACTAIGSYKDSSSLDHPLAERWNGSSWTIQALPSGGSLADVSCTSTPTACVAVGDDAGQPLAERWDGSTWATQSVSLPSSGQNGALEGVSCTTSSACTAVGHFLDGSLDFERDLVERWNGSSWTPQSTPFHLGFQLSTPGVSCPSLTACTAIGNAVGPTSTDAFIERWDGSSWTDQTPPSVGLPRRVSCPSTTWCTAAGGQ